MENTVWGKLVELKKIKMKKTPKEGVDGKP